MVQLILFCIKFSVGFVRSILQLEKIKHHSFPRILVDFRKQLQIQTNGELEDTLITHLATEEQHTTNTYFMTHQCYKKIASYIIVLLSTSNNSGNLSKSYQIVFDKLSGESIKWSGV